MSPDLWRTYYVLLLWAVNAPLPSSRQENRFNKEAWVCRKTAWPQIQFHLVTCVICFSIFNVSPRYLRFYSCACWGRWCCGRDPAQRGSEVAVLSSWSLRLIGCPEGLSSVPGPLDPLALHEGWSSLCLCHRHLNCLQVMPEQIQKEWLLIFRGIWLLINTTNSYEMT